jgi:hypothetical protein
MKYVYKTRSGYAIRYPGYSKSFATKTFGSEEAAKQAAEAYLVNHPRPKQEKKPTKRSFTGLIGIIPYRDRNQLIGWTACYTTPSGRKQKEFRFRIHGAMALTKAKQLVANPPQV